MEVGKLNIEPFTLEAVMEIHIKEILNDHAVFYLLARLEEDQEDDPIFDISNETSIKLTSDGTVLFIGVIKNINITCVDSVYYLRVAAVSNTIKIDVETKRRSFQDAGMKYRSIVEKITKSKSSSVTFGDSKAADKTVENILLQYDETDWMFSKRLASHSNAVLIPKLDSETPDFIFGVKESKPKDELESYNYSTSKNLDVYRAMSQFPALGFSENDCVVYTIIADDYAFNLGDVLTLDGDPLYVSAIDVKLVGSVLKCAYTLSTKTAVSAAKFYNDIIGLHLLGEVWKVVNDTVMVRLDIDEADTVDNGQDKDNSYKFKYSTPYTAEKHTGWYVMPEEEDMLQVIFPTEDEKEAYATTAIRQEDTGKTNDHLVKYLRTPFGKEIKFDKNEILISAKDDTTFIRINEDEKKGIEIITPHPIKVKSKNKISMESDDDFTIKTKKNLIITADKAISMTTNSTNSMLTMEFDDPGIKFGSEDPVKVFGKTVDISSKDGFTAKAGKDLSVSSDSKVKISGSSAVEATGGGASIKMDGNVEIKGIMIKEN